MTTIIMDYETETILRKTLSEEEENIRIFKPSKHKKPSLGDAYNYLIYKRDKQIKAIKIITTKIIDAKTLEEAKNLAENILLYE